MPRSPRKGNPGNPSPLPSGRCSVCRSQSPCSDIAVEGRALQSFAADGGGTWLAASSMIEDEGRSMKFRWNGSSCTAFNRESSMHSPSTALAQPLHSSCVADTQHSAAMHSASQCIALAPGSPISLARFREVRGIGALEWERCVAAAEGLEPTEQLRGLSLRYL